MDVTVPALGATSPHERLVAGMVALEGFLCELHSASGQEEILSRTLQHLGRLLPMQAAAFYLPDEGGLSFCRATPLPEEAAARLNGLVDQAIDSGIFGWALNHRRPAAFKAAGGQGTLILAALRARRRLLGMLVALLGTRSVTGWDASAITLATHLACTGDALLTDQLTLELQAHNRHLDSLVQERTREALAAKEVAEVANRAKSSFLATVSHELRTPLNAILGYTQILLSDSLPQAHYEKIRTIHQAGEHLLTLINDLLDLSKAEAAHIEIAPVRVVLGELLEETIALVRPRAEQKALHFQCTLEAGLPRSIMVDPKRLKQVLLNLLNNAVKFTDQGFVLLVVGHHPGSLRFLVSDSGPGIAPGDLPKLFQPFQQLGAAARQAEGTGLGLSVSKRILEVMGVQLCVRSQVAQGSTFWFDLPCVEPAGETSPAIQLSAVPPAEPPLPTLPAATLNRLRTLAATGDILAMRQELQHLISESAPANPALNRLLELAKQCRIKALCESLDHYERDHPDRR